MAKLSKKKPRLGSSVRKSGVPKDYLAPKPQKADQGASNATPRSVTVTQAQNGYITRHEPKPSKNGGYVPDVTNVHSDTTDMTSFIKNLFSGDAGDQKTRRVKAAKAAMSDPSS
jgi:hypothetical protein